MASEVRFVLVFKYFERKPNRCRCILFRFLYHRARFGKRGWGVLSDFFLSNSPCVSVTIGADSDLGMLPLTT